jgi:polysaccharide deacetylase 2 family uncharacterized protein YibQ
MSRRRLPYALLTLLLLGVAISAVAAWQLDLRGPVRFTAAASPVLPLSPPAVTTAESPTSPEPAALPAEVPERPAGLERLQGIELLDAAEMPPRAAMLPRPDAAPARIAIIVAGIGLAQAKSERALALPAAVTLAVSPYAEDADGWLDRVRGRGHEAALLVPLEATDPARVDNGPLALRPQMLGAELEDGLARVLGQARGPFLVAMEAGAFGENAAAAEGLTQLVQARGLGLIELAGDRLAAMAGTTGLAYGAAGDALDAVPEVAAIDVGLGRMEGQALRQRAAIGWVEGIPVALDRLEQGAGSLAGKGLQLVPAGALLGDPAVAGLADAH